MPDENPRYEDFSVLDLLQNHQRSKLVLDMLQTLVVEGEYIAQYLMPHGKTKDLHDKTIVLAREVVNFSINNCLNKHEAGFRDQMKTIWGDYSFIRSSTSKQDKLAQLDDAYKNGITKGKAAKNKLNKKQLNTAYSNGYEKGVVAGIKCQQIIDDGHD